MPRKWVMLLFKEMEYNTFTNAIIMMLITITKLTIQVVEWDIWVRIATKKIWHTYMQLWEFQWALLSAHVMYFVCRKYVTKLLSTKSKSCRCWLSFSIITPFFSVKKISSLLFSSSSIHCEWWNTLFNILWERNAILPVWRNESRMQLSIWIDQACDCVMWGCRSSSHNHKNIWSSPSARLL